MELMAAASARSVAVTHNPSIRVQILTSTAPVGIENSMSCSGVVATRPTRSTKVAAVARSSTANRACSACASFRQSRNAARGMRVEAAGFHLGAGASMRCHEIDATIRAFVRMPEGARMRPRGLASITGMVAVAMLSGGTAVASGSGVPGSDPVTASATDAAADPVATSAATEVALDLAAYTHVHTSDDGFKLGMSVDVSKVMLGTDLTAVNAAW